LNAIRAGDIRGSGTESVFAAGMPMKSAYWRSEVGIFLGIWLVLVVGGRTQLFRDPGALWHSVVGERILSSGQLVRVDPFSFQTPGERWIAMQWLGECIMAMIRRVAGFDGMLIVAASIIAFLFTWGAHRLLVFFAPAATGCPLFY
jgi:hypothetical protein